MYVCACVYACMCVCECVHERACVSTAYHGELVLKTLQKMFRRNYDAGSVPRFSTPVENAK